MVVCNFFLQGRCRYGEKCWNEHPRGGNRGSGGGYNESYNRSSGQQQFRGESGGFRNRVWVNPSQQRGNYIQPSAFSSQERSDWGSGGGGGGGRGGGGRRENVKSSEFAFSTQNRFSGLGSSNSFERGGRGGGTPGDEDDDKKLEIIQMDMDVWESSGQWGFSCYSCSKASISGFSDLSPEELRLEYYSTRASGDLQSYLRGVNQLLSNWKSRVQELKIMSPATRVALLAELNGTAPPSATGGFGSTTAKTFGFPSSSFGSEGFGAPAPAPAQASSFSFAAPSSSSSPSAGFGSALAAPTQPPSSFGSSSALSASTFSFAAPNADKPAASSGFGSASAFSFSSTANTGGGFGTGFGTGAPGTAGGSSVLGQTGFGTASSTPSAVAGSVGGPSDSLFSTESKLTEEELNQFKAKRFTLGQIPLKPPPANMLVL
ncbi:nucleoporin NUP42 [Austrofundulus limnaeus]|uniref:Nucleoporin NUP42 n=1 Tax=Austrofundulus limnaeus TaxID=52670 RepID=A0A2I4BFY7_AUSLI|nr:PREDICTED: nucleoporin-like protein 2 [Austrofundulus limnaeus]